MTFGIRTKLTFAFGVLCLFPLLLTGLVSTYIFKVAMHENIQSLENSVLRQKTEETKKFLQEIIALFEVRVGYSDFLPISEEGSNFLLEKLLQENPNIKEAALIDLGGQEKYSRSNVQDASLTDLYDVSNLDLFKKPMSGITYISPVYQTLNGPMVDVSAPVKNSAGKVIMVFSGKVSLLPLRNIYASAGLGKNGYVYVVDSNRRIIASSDSTLAGHTLEGMYFMDIILNSGLITEKPGLLSSDIYTLSTPINGTEWMAVVEWPREDALGVIGRLLSQYLIFSAGLAIVILLLGWLLGRRLLIPLFALRAGAEEFGREKFEHRINIKTGDELEELGKTMNIMALNLKQHRLELEDSHKKIEDNLREISKLKDDFIFVAAHELRSPVTVLQGYVAEILEDEKTIKKLEKQNPYFVDMVRGIEVSKDRLSTLVDDLLNIARMGSGKFKIDVKPDVDLNASLEPLLRTMAELGKQRKISIKFKKKGKLPKLKIDPNRVSEVLTNLISNAIKYNRDNGSITVTAEFADGRLYMAVADTGIGLSPEEQEHLFEKFWRSDDVRNLQGTGLGLFIVKHILEQMGGTISFESEKGKGTTFKFDIPAA